MGRSGKLLCKKGLPGESILFSPPLKSDLGPALSYEPASFPKTSLKSDSGASLRVTQKWHLPMKRVTQKWLFDGQGKTHLLKWLLSHSQGDPPESLLSEVLGKLAGSRKSSPKRKLSNWAAFLRGHPGVKRAHVQVKGFGWALKILGRRKQACGRGCPWPERGSENFGEKNSGWFSLCQCCCPFHLFGRPLLWMAPSAESRIMITIDPDYHRPKHCWTTYLFVADTNSGKLFTFSWSLHACTWGSVFLHTVGLSA